MDGLYAAASLAMRYWFIIAAAVMLLGATGISLREYRDRRYVLGVAGNSIGYLHVISGPEDIMGANLQLMSENTIGRSRKVDIVLADSSVYKAHSQIYKNSAGVFVNRLGRGDVSVNGLHVESSAEVFDGDVICFGNVAVKLRLKEEQ